jgi:adenylosuccinate synthase
VARCQPIYEEFPGWNTSTFGLKEWDALPETAQAYLKRVEEVAGIPIAMISTGPDRDETILLRHPYKD